MIVFLLTIDGSGSTFTFQLVRGLLRPKYFCRLGKGDDKISAHEGLFDSLILSTFWNGDYLAIPYATIPQVEYWLDRADKIVSPIRDPIKILGTAATMQRSHEHIIWSLLKFVEWSRQYGVFYVPVDIDDKFVTPGKGIIEKHANLLEGLAAYLGLPSNLEFQTPWAEKWPKMNESSLYREKKQEPSQEAVGLLDSYKDELRPFLEGIGYRELSWWE